ncbi:hypothetical protein [Allonocardiopsis opalescens]|uniref:Secreted protein n=1 Tax=Allonocardiopsis opalescens TaxID=1144618 RepID=A0A2T0Q2R9_9ACTN|nr:hypothetical protein [Allonocardiopsis opalescens]PRX98086.1 hypothetical protein CLV72_105439 [Allonocardiopsis opalescens]
MAAYPITIRPAARAALAAVPALLAGLLLASCGGGAEGSGAEAGPSAASGEDALLAYAQCMRDQGVEMPDPEPGEPASLYEGVDQDSPAFTAADEACAEHLAGVVQERQNTDPEEEQQNNDELLAIAECLREQGIDVPDPVPGQEGGPFAGELDRTDPAVQEALDACSDAGVAPSEGGGE